MSKFVNYKRSLEIIGRIVSEPVLSSGLLSRESILASPPASLAQLAALEGVLPRRLSESHRQLLLTWNGLNLDVVRLLGAPPVCDGIDPLPQWQTLIPSTHPSWIAIGTDPAGFLYAQDERGKIWSIDHDGGTEKRLSSSLDEFLGDYVFGKRAAEFGGESWRDDLVTHGILSVE